MTAPAPARILTRRQLQILTLAANGNSAADIGRWLWVTPDTVNGVLRYAYRALGVTDRAHAVAVALRLGLIGLEEIRLPETASVPLPPAELSAPPMPRRTPPGPSGDNAARFPTPASRQTARRSEAPTRNGPQNAPGGVSRALGAPGGPVPASSPGATTTAASQRIDQETQR